MRLAISLGCLLVLGSCGADLSSLSAPATAASTAGDRLAVTDGLREACGHVDLGDFGIQILLASFEADRMDGITKSEQLDLGIERCREDGGASLNKDCLTCVGAVVDQLYGP